MKIVRCAVIASLAGLAACHQNGAGSAASSAPAVATVNGTTISRTLYDFYLKGVAQGKDPKDLTPQQRQEALDSLVRAELVAQQADKDGVTKNPNTADLLELARLNAVQQAFSEKFVKDNKPTDQDIKAEYDKQVALLPHTEYHARHILVDSEDKAKAIIAQLAKGAKFDELAKKESSDSSKTSGGDLGWFTPDHMVKPFADAVVALKPGDYTATPVQTQFGWHVIKLEETRPLAAPPFDNPQIKQQLEQMVLREKFKSYVDGLLKTAQVDKKL